MWDLLRPKHLKKIQKPQISGEKIQLKKNPIRTRLGRGTQNTCAKFHDQSLKNGVHFFYERFFFFFSLEMWHYLRPMYPKNTTPHNIWRKKEEKRKSPLRKARQGHVKHMFPKFQDQSLKKRRRHWTLEDLGFSCLNQPDIWCRSLPGISLSVQKCKDRLGRNVKTQTSLHSRA